MDSELWGEYRIPEQDDAMEGGWIGSLSAREGADGGLERVNWALE